MTQLRIETAPRGTMFRLMIIALLWLSGALYSAHAGTATPIFALEDFIGRAWSNACVVYPVAPKALKAIDGRRLVDAGGAETLYQLDPEHGTLAFLADVPPFGKTQYHFADAPVSRQSDLAIRETEACIEITSSRAGIRIARTLTGRAAPLQAWRLASGAWAGKTEFTTAPTIADYKVTVTERGPVRAKVICEVSFSDGDRWTLSFVVQAFDAAIKVTETFVCDTSRTYRYAFSENFPAEILLTRSSAVNAYKGKRYPYGTPIQQQMGQDEEPVLFIYEPWVHWGGQANRNTSFTLLDATWGNSVFMAAISPDLWVDPSLPSFQRVRPQTKLIHDAEDGVTLDLELKHGQRQYLLGSVAGDDDREWAEQLLSVPPPAQKAQIKHGDYPLDRVKDWVLTWPVVSQKEGGFLSEADVQTLTKDLVFSEKGIANLRREQTVSPHGLERYAGYYLASGDPEVERVLVNSALAGVQGTVDRLVKLEDIVTVGFAPHHFLSFITTCNLVDLIDHSPLLEGEKGQRLRAQLAFLGYVFNRDAFCSPARGFSGFPNMTAAVYGVRAAIGSVVPGHPEQAPWLRDAAARLARGFTDHWVDESGAYNGSAVESLHYALIATDIALAAAYRSYASGADTESLFSPSLKMIGQWYAESATPRDSRLLGWRHFPPVGHVYKFEVAPALYAMLAFMWKDRDPVFASEMKWMQLEQGNEYVQAVGGFVPSFAGYRKLMMANDVEPVQPTYTSRHWKETSVILRNHYGHALENMLYMIAGNGHSHYDQDSGSITLWGKGEIIADDFGYNGMAPGENQSMLDSRVASPGKIMRVDAFETSEVLDFVRGTKDAWQRRIALVKHPDPAGPNYFVIQDGLSIPAPAAWRMWLTTKQLTVDGRHARSMGLDRIDTEIHFAALPEQAVVTTPDKTCTPYGIDSDGRYRRVSTTQTAITITAPRFQNLLTLVLPHLKDETPPQVETIADGHGFKLSAATGTDYIFMSHRPVTYQDGALTFRGTVGFARIANEGSVTLDLKEGGDISYGDEHLSRKAEPSERVSGNMIPDGELLSGAFSLFPKQGPDRNFAVSLLNHAPPELAGVQDEPATLKGPYCQKIVKADPFKPEASGFLAMTTPKVHVDKKRTYRIKARVFIPGTNRVMLSSYGKKETGGQIDRWAWSLSMQGPTEGFQDFEMTLGPKDSGADQNLHPDVLTLATLGIRMYGEDGGSFYIDDFSVEPLPKGVM